MQENLRRSAISKILKTTLFGSSNEPTISHQDHIFLPILIFDANMNNSWVACNLFLSRNEMLHSCQTHMIHMFFFTLFICTFLKYSMWLIYLHLIFFFLLFKIHFIHSYDFMHIYNEFSYVVLYTNYFFSREYFTCCSFISACDLFFMLKKSDSFIFTCNFFLWTILFFHLHLSLYYYLKTRLIYLHVIFSCFIFHNSWFWLSHVSIISTFFYTWRMCDFIYHIHMRFTYAISGQYIVKFTFTLNLFPHVIRYWHNAMWNHFIFP